MEEKEIPPAQENAPEYGLPPSPWLVPPSKAPKMSHALGILLAGFILLFGGLFYNLYSILHGESSFTLFMLIMIISLILIIIGAVMVARSYGSRKYAELKERYGKMAIAGMRRCPYCGRAIPADAVVCPYCGAKLKG